MATCFGLFETNNEVTGADIAAMPAYMSTAIAAAHGYTATIVTNANSDAIYAYVARMLPTQLTAQIAAIDASLARQQTGISAIIAARTSGAGAGLTKTLADLDAALTAANEAATLDDPVAIAAAGRDAAAAVAAAWQEVNNINARAAETFAGLGPGSFAMSVAGFMGWAGEWGDIIWAGIGGAGHGLAMFANAATWHLTPLDGYVDGLIAENGGMYATANVFAHISAYAAEAAGGIVIYQGLNALAMYSLGVQGYSVTGHAAVQAFQQKRQSLLPQLHSHSPCRRYRSHR